MRRLKLVLISFAALAASILHGEIKTLDFSDGNHSFSVFERSDVQLTPFKGVRYLRTIEGGTYRILLPGNIEYLLEIERGEVRNHIEKEGYVNTLKLTTRRLSLEASKKLAHTFHQQFGLDEKELNEWFNLLEAGEAYSRYGKGGVGKHYPRMGMGLRTTFGKEQPAFAIFSVSWDESFSKRWGTSLESNKQLNITYDMPELLKGVPEFTEVPEVEPVIVKVGQPRPVMEKVTAPEPAIEEPAEVVVAEPVEEGVEQSSNWLLWLIGVVVVVGGVFVLRSRK